MTQVPSPLSTTRMMEQRVGLFLDVTNMFHAAKNGCNAKLDFKRLLEGTVAQRALIRAFAYIIQKENIDQSSFHTMLQRVGFETRVKEQKVHVDNVGAAVLSRPSLGVDLTLDASAMADRLDVVVLVTCDGQFAPLVKHLKTRGVRVEVCGVLRQTSTELINAADQFIPISNEWLIALETPTSTPSQLGTTASGQVDLKGLPKDEVEA